MITCNGNVRMRMMHFPTHHASFHADPALREEGAKAANLFIKRQGGAWWFVGHKPDTSVRFRVRTPDGAPADAVEYEVAPQRGAAIVRNYTGSLYAIW